MSNKVVPTLYAGIIDDVVHATKDRFEEEGLDEDGALTLRRLWEANLRLTRVAPFKEAEEDDLDPDMDDGEYGQDEGGYDMPDDQQEYQQQYGLDANGNGAYYGGLKGGSVITMRLRGGVLSEDDDEEFDEEGEDEEDVKPFDTNGKLDAGRVAEYNKLAKLGDEDTSDAASSSAKPTRDARGALLTRNPEVKPNENGIYPGEEIIGSDLDDSDQDEEDGPYDDEDDEEQDDLAKDVMICVCDKVQRVKNKWKVTFKDGFIRANGKEYVFSRCTGEFEW